MLVPMLLHCEAEWPLVLLSRNNYISIIDSASRPFTWRACGIMVHAQLCQVLSPSLRLSSSSEKPGSDPVFLFFFFFSFFFWGGGEICSANFDLKNIISTYTKGFP
jgi:hypothetical protein